MKVGIDEHPHPPYHKNKKKAKSPKKKALSPKRKVNSPTKKRTLSPTKKRTLSPKKRVSSPKRKVNSPTPNKLTSAPPDFKTKKPLYKPYKSTAKNKKGMVYVMKDNRKKLIHFGYKPMSDYTQHHDKKRRKNYLERSGGIRDEDGHLTKNDKNSANYWARRVLW